jgi:hypothetical protein
VDFREEVSAGRFPARNLLPADSKTDVENTAFADIFQPQRILFLKEWRMVFDRLPRSRHEAGYINFFRGDSLI